MTTYLPTLTRLAFHRICQRFRHLFINAPYTGTLIRHLFIYAIYTGTLICSSKHSVCSTKQAACST